MCAQRLWSGQRRLGFKCRGKDLRCEWFDGAPFGGQPRREWADLKSNLWADVEFGEGSRIANVDDLRIALIH